ncbi:hypothetical protein IWX46DRAFT_123757 [Phyllosticta citricarpa]
MPRLLLLLSPTSHFIHGLTRPPPLSSLVWNRAAANSCLVDAWARRPQLVTHDVGQSHPFSIGTLRSIFFYLIVGNPCSKVVESTPQLASSRASSRPGRTSQASAGERPKRTTRQLLFQGLIRPDSAQGRLIFCSSGSSSIWRRSKLTMTRLRPTKARRTRLPPHVPSACSTARYSLLLTGLVSGKPGWPHE